MPYFSYWMAYFSYWMAYLSYWLDPVEALGDLRTTRNLDGWEHTLPKPSPDIGDFVRTSMKFDMGRENESLYTEHDSMHSVSLSARTLSPRTVLPGLVFEFGKVGVPKSWNFKMSNFQNVKSSRLQILQFQKPLSIKMLVHTIPTFQKLYIRVFTKMIFLKYEVFLYFQSISAISKGSKVQHLVKTWEFPKCRKKHWKPSPSLDKPCLTI